jgi:FkbM family methyltransferase
MLNIIPTVQSAALLIHQSGILMDEAIRHAGKNQYSQAAESCRESLKLNPNATEAYIFLANTFSNLGMLQSAQKAAFLANITQQLNWQKEAEFISRFIRPHEKVFDVGMNLGQKTDIYLALGAHVVGFEPNPGLVQILTEKYQLNERVTVVNEGLASKSGSLDLEICSAAPTISTFNPMWKQGRFSDYQWDQIVTVQTRTLDSAISQYGLPSFCKIDVEGFENEVLAGLTCPIPFVSFEFAIECSNVLNECLVHMEKVGYKLFNIAIGSVPNLALSNWVSSDILLESIAILSESQPLLWGDIYAAW